MKTSRRASVRRHPIFLPPPSPLYLQFHSGFEWAASYRGFNVDASACFSQKKVEATGDGNDSVNWVVLPLRLRARFMPCYVLNFTPAITLRYVEGGSRAIPETILGREGGERCRDALLEIGFYRYEL